MRLRPPPITGNPALDAWLRDVYESMIQVSMFVGHWAQTNVAASQTGVALTLLGTSDNTLTSFPVDGNIVGISVASNTARTAGTLTVAPTIGGTASTTLTAIIDGTNTQYASGVDRHVNNAFESGQSIGVQITTTGVWAPTTADVVIGLMLKFGRE